jgi:hypothetical protein
MSFVNERAYIEARLSANWATTPIDWENVDFDTPNNSPWIRLSVLNGESDRRNINSGKRHLGLVVIQIFVPINTGTNTIRGYADTLAAVFEDQDFDDVECGIASIAIIGNSDVWYQVNVTIPYRRNES